MSALVEDLILVGFLVYTMTILVGLPALLLFVAGRVLGVW